MAKKTIARTLCDFGEQGRADVIQEHFTLKSSLSGYKKIWDIYHRGHGWKVWQELIK